MIQTQKDLGFVYAFMVLNLPVNNLPNVNNLLNNFSSDLFFSSKLEHYQVSKTIRSS